MENVRQCSISRRTSINIRANSMPLDGIFSKYCLNYIKMTLYFDYLFSIFANFILISHPFYKCRTKFPVSLKTFLFWEIKQLGRYFPCCLRITGSIWYYPRFALTRQSFWAPPEYIRAASKPYCFPRPLTL